jgi:hypothetical protein
LTSSLGNLQTEPSNEEYKSAAVAALMAYASDKGWSEANTNRALNVGPVAGITDDPVFAAARSFLKANEKGESTSQAWEDVVAAEEYFED